MIKHKEQGFVEENLSNFTSPISCEASVSSSSNNNNRGEASNYIYHQQQQYLPQLSQQDHHQSDLELSEEPPTKKKRNLPGHPDPESEVIALSPKTLLATNRFVCEICNKGFQRDQNLQLHRRGHNLPWKLKQRSKTEVIKKKVYVCPEESCVHHDPSRALGDLTGIKKHFSRKHGEKKYKCDKCSKRYAVQSDWKAHSKVCGTREYRCDCGTLFSRRDSFITHRAFCDALAEETARAITSTQTQPLITNTLPNNEPSNNTQFINIQQHLINNVPPWLACPPSPSPSSIFLHRDTQNPITEPTPPHMSATALLQKAAQTGATISKNTPHVTGMFGLSLPSRDQLSSGPGSDPNTNPSSSSSSSSFVHDMMVNSISSSYDDAFGIGNMVSNNNNNKNDNNFRSQTFYRTIGGGNDGLTRDFFGIKTTTRQQETHKPWQT